MFQTYNDLPTAPSRKITKLAFRNRFTSQEKAKIEMATLDNPSGTLEERTFAASIRASLADQRDAEYIDLDRPDTRQGVTDMETYLVIATGRALEILDAPTAPEEVFQR